MDYDEELTGQATRQFFEKLHQLLIQQNKNHFELGKMLHRIRRQQLYSNANRKDGSGRGYPTFEAFCNEHMGFSRSKGDMLCTNFERLSAMELDEDGNTFARCLRLGWSKLNEVLRVAGDEDNLILWMNEAEDISTEMLRLRISQMQRASYEGTSRPSPTATDLSLNGVEPPGPSRRRRVPVPAPGTEHEGDPDQPLAAQNPVGYVAYQVRFPDAESQEVFVRALRLIKTRYDADIGAGTAIGMMALHYITTVPSEAQGGAPTELEDVIRLMEPTYGVRLRVEEAEVETTAARTKRRRAAVKKKKKRKKKTTK